MRHRTKEETKAGAIAVYVAAISRYRVKEAERTWKHSIAFNSNRRSSLKGRLFVSGANGRDEKRLHFVLLRFFSFSSRSFLFTFFFLSLFIREWGNLAVGMPLFDFLFSFFFTCSSNARWKMPTRRVGVGVEHPFPWFWQLLAFVSAMEVVLGVLCYYLRASLSYSALTRESLISLLSFARAHVCVCVLCIYVSIRLTLNVTMSNVLNKQTAIYTWTYINKTKKKTNQISTWLLMLVT